VDDAEVERVVEVLSGGGVVVLPTDTVYGLATLPGGEDRLYELKGRPGAVPIAVLVASEAQARGLATSWPAAAERLARRFWPGPLTLVVATEGGSTLGVRFPDHQLLAAVARQVGPVATTSANAHGRPTPPTAAEAAASLTGPVDLVVDGGRLDGVASSVVAVTGPKPVVLREGAIPAEDLVTQD